MACLYFPPSSISLSLSLFADFFLLSLFERAHNALHCIGRWLSHLFVVYSGTIKA